MAATRGFEAEVNGQMTPDWFLSANFTHTYKRYDSPNERLQTYLPKNMLRVWSLYKLPGELEKWSVQGGALAKSEEDVLTFAMFPDIGRKFLEERAAAYT